MIKDCFPKLIASALGGLTLAFSFLLMPIVEYNEGDRMFVEFKMPTAFADEGGDSGGDSGGDRDNDVENTRKSPTLRRNPGFRVGRQPSGPAALRTNVYAMARLVQRTKRELDNARARQRALDLLIYQYSGLKGAAVVPVMAVFLLAHDNFEQEIKDLQIELRWAVEEMARHGS